MSLDAVSAGTTPAGIAHWQARLDELAARHQVPGATLAILDAGQIGTAATGVLNLETGVPVTADAVFQIGSITKVWTTTMLMQLADEGLLDLDAPLSEVLPELSLATPGATEQITVRHLLSHSSGIDGDVFDDCGRGTDCVERYVANCARLPLIHPVGATMSYCNSGFVIAGRIVEVLTGMTWDEALRSRLIEPLGLHRTLTLAEEAIRFRAACGHLEVGGTQQLAPVWALPGGSGPAGGIIATASDVITFAQLHLNAGTTGDGTRLLSADSSAAMQQPEVEVPAYPEGARRVGLGWQLHNWSGHRLIAHNGGTIGQYAFLYVLPDRDAAVCLLTNGGHAQSLFQDLFTEIFGALWQVEVPEPPQPLAGARELPVDQARYTGRYEREGIRLDVEPSGTGLELTATDTGPFASLVPDEDDRAQLLPVAEDVFAGRTKDTDPWSVFVFYELDGGARYVHSGGRATPRRD
jgi:CubicO group peptidase (beta-lactamase class C family)